MSSVALFSPRPRDPAKPNLARSMDLYERGYNAAVIVVLPEIRRQRHRGIGIGFVAGIAAGVVVAVMAAGWLA